MCTSIEDCSDGPSLIPSTADEPMDGQREPFIAFDTAKLRNAVAVAEGGRAGELRYLSEIANTPEAVRNLVAKP